jgi:hypothetical protein
MQFVQVFISLANSNVSYSSRDKSSSYRKPVIPSVLSDFLIKLLLLIRVQREKAEGDRQSMRSGLQALASQHPG